MQNKSYNQQGTRWVGEVWRGGSYFLDEYAAWDLPREEKHETEFELEVAFESFSSHFRGEQSETQKYWVTSIRKHGQSPDSDSQLIWHYSL